MTTAGLAYVPFALVTGESKEQTYRDAGRGDTGRGLLGIMHAKSLLVKGGAQGDITPVH